jgi:hypothetical protein
MFPIIEFTKCLQGTMKSANLQLFLALLQSFLCIRWGTTTSRLSRYCDYSPRQIFRFLLVQHQWLEIRLLLFKNFIYRRFNFEMQFYFWLNFVLDCQILIFFLVCYSIYFEFQQYPQQKNH